MPARSDVPHILHCHSTFAPGGKELRAVQLMNAFGKDAQHTIVSGVEGERGAADHIDPGTAYRIATDFPPLTGWPTPGRLVAIAQAMKPFDLVLSYNWGAIDAAMAHTVFAEALGLPPLIHHEDGFNEDETDGLKPRRNWYRRAAMGRVHALVVPSRGLEAIAAREWKCPPVQVVRIPNGIDTRAFGKKPDPSKLRLMKRPGERWVGTLAGLRPVKQLPLLVEACAKLDADWHLVILGEGPEREAIQARADALEVSHRVHLPGALTDPASVIGLFDIFALASRSEQFPLSVVEAMAAGLPVAAPQVGDIASMVSEANRPYIAPAGDEGALAQKLGELAADARLRRKIGKANRERARERFDARDMIAAYRELYWVAMESA
ncbi:glycosyltransferase [Erythrobacter sp.]|jgi:glycosyltransferase involved in cell wall biosynthesis|uniref:glycosyltransferase n=1 Tax=Erythrobacter sp. TaxID=1042 RepID=UPI002EA86C15|nr:glycosyltransferase [Erythrobacter sp.]